MSRFFVSLMALALPAVAWAEVDPKCADLEGNPPPDYDADAQESYLLNYYALTATHSALHGPIPHEPGHGSIGVDLKMMVPLSCKRRMVENYSKTEDTNKSPVLPVLTASYAFPAVKGVMVPYASVSFLPPIPVGGTQNFLMSGELGLGFYVTEDFTLGVRFHASILRTVGDVATHFEPGDPDYDDLYIGTTLGADLMVGYTFDWITPYLSFGFTDVSTIFWIGDTDNLQDNLYPYLGMSYSLGADMLIKKRFRLAVEYYGAPGGSRDLLDLGKNKGFGEYGKVHTARIRLGVEI